MLDEEKDKRLGKKKEVFIKGRQSTLYHVLMRLSNIIAFSRFWTGYDPNNKNDLPLIAKILTDIANEISLSDYQEFHTSMNPFINIWNIPWSRIASTYSPNLQMQARILPFPRTKTQQYYR